jgi:serine-threonine kinase receptor-associated protein
MLRSGTTGDWIGTFLGHKGAVWSCALDPSATLAATASADFSAKIWDALTGLEKATLQHKHIVKTCCFSQSSNKLVTGGHEKLLRVYDVERPDVAPAEFAGAPKDIKAAVYVGPSDSLLVTSISDTPSLVVWDAREGRTVRTLSTDGPVTSVDLTHDGRWLTTTDNQNTVRIWDTSSLDSPIKQFVVSHPVEAASYCPLKNRFVAGGEDMWVHLHDAATGAELEVNKGHHGPVHTVRFGPEGKEYASGSEDGTIRLWQTDWLEQQQAAAAEAGVAMHATAPVAAPYTNGRGTGSRLRTCGYCSIRSLVLLIATQAQHVYLDCSCSSSFWWAAVPAVLCCVLLRQWLTVCYVCRHNHALDGHMGCSC